jgi:hypothetical protein
MKKAPIPRYQAAMLGKTIGCTPITNPEEFLNGEFQILHPLYDLFPSKMSLMENHNGYVIEDAEGRIYCLSHGAVTRLGWDEYDFPESDAYKTHVEKRIEKYGKQEIK